MDKNMIYCSGPMSNIPGFNHKAFNENAAFLRSKGWNVFSPAEMDLELGVDLSGPLTEEQYQTLMRNDYRALTECSAIAFLPGWEGSRGAKLESDFANVLKLDRYRVDASQSYFEKELVIGVTGWARSGKDSIAQEFVTNMNFQRIGFADSLKKILYGLNPILPMSDILPSRFVTGSNVRVQDYVDLYGYEESKKVTEIRELLQRLGTEGGRVALGEEIWVKTLFNSPTTARIVIPDVRFANEAAEIQRRGGKVIRVIRPGVEPANDHSSEQIDFDVDFTVQNDRTPKDAYLDIVDFLGTQGITIKSLLTV